MRRPTLCERPASARAEGPLWWRWSRAIRWGSARPGGHGAGVRLRPEPVPVGPESLLSRLASGGVRTLLLDGGEALAEPFLAGGLVNRAVAYSPGLDPSWRPGASAPEATLAFPPS